MAEGIALRENEKKTEQDCKNNINSVSPKNPGDRLTEILAYIESIKNIMGDNAGMVITQERVITQVRMITQVRVITQVW